MSTVEAIERDGVRGFLHRPDASAQSMSPPSGLVLTHGAGGDCRAPLLVAAAEAFTTAGVCTLRCDLPFRQRRAKGPPSPAGAAADRAGLREAVALMRTLTAGPVRLGGQSYGGRQATLLAADAPGLVAALMLFSYPLHPPGKPERRRTEHFPQLRVPALFVHGSADPFGTLAEIEAAAALIPAPTRIVAVTGAGHDLRRGRFDLAALPPLLLSL